MKTAASHKTIVLVSTVSIAMLLVSSLAALNILLGPDEESDSRDELIVQLQGALRADDSRIANLTAQIAEIKNQVIELERALDRKTTDNVMLKKEALDLSNAILDIEAQLRLLEKNEQACLIVDRLRQTVNVSEDGSLSEG
jgi:chromosome segregation ATPase